VGIKYFIIGFPRTATTYTYLYIYNKFKGKVKGVFEPFNGEVVDWCLQSDVTYHYRQGRVPHDLRKLPREVVNLIYENSRWFHEWRKKWKPTKPLLGEKWRQVVVTLNSLPYPILVKDVCAWVKLCGIAEMLPNTRILVTLRDYKYVYKTYTNPEMLSREGRRGTLKIKNIIGLSFFYRYFYGLENYPNADKEVADLPTLVAVLRKTYDKYVELVNGCEKQYSNIRVLRFGEKLTNQQIEEAIK